MEIDVQFLAVAIPAVIFAAVSKSGFGSGAAFAAAAVLALVVEPGVALGVMLPLLMLIDVASLRPYWRKWSWPDTRALLVGAVPGVGIGAWLYTVADADLFRLLIGGVSIAFVAWQFAQHRGWIRPAAQRLPPWAAVAAGAIAGFASFVSHAGGPPAAVYLLSQRLTKTRYQATTVLLFWTINLAKFVPYAFLGMFTWETLQANIILAPFALLGTWLGVVAHRIVPETMFFAITYVLLSVTGSKLIWDALG